MSYIERLKTMGRSANPFFALMGIDLAEAGEGWAVLRMDVRPDMMNGEGWLQGGIFCALADEAMVLAIYPMLAPGETIATISETTEFLGGAREGTLFARGEVARKGRRVVFATGEVRMGNPGGPVLSRSIASFIISRAPGGKKEEKRE